VGYHSVDGSSSFFRNIGAYQWLTSKFIDKIENFTSFPCSETGIAGRNSFRLVLL